MLWGVAAARLGILTVVQTPKQERPVSDAFDPRKSATAFDQASPLVVVLELSCKSWRAGASVPGVSRRPLRGLEARDLGGVLRAIEPWKREASRAGHEARRVVVGYEAGLDGFWIARALREHGIEVDVMHEGEHCSRASRPARQDRPHRRRHSSRGRFSAGSGESRVIARWRPFRARRRRTCASRDAGARP